MSLGALPIAAPEELTGAALEGAARDALRAKLRLRVTVNAPTWRQLVFRSSRISFTIPATPPEVVAEIARATTDDLQQDHVGVLAFKLLEGLQASMPAGRSPRSMAGRRPLPVGQGAMGAWRRRVFLVAAGPQALRLLVAAGYLTAGDVALMTEVYPEGLHDERLGAVEAAGAITAAAARAGRDADLPAWLDDQLFTLMEEERPTDFFQSLYAPEQEDPEPGPTVGAPQHAIVDQARPPVGPR